MTDTEQMLIEKIKPLPTQRGAWDVTPRRPVKQELPEALHLDNY